MPKLPLTKNPAYPAGCEGIYAEGAIRHLILKLSASKTPTAPSQKPV
jgi:hypothetical protein